MEATIQVPPNADKVAVFGASDRNLKMIREGLGVGIVARGELLRLTGDAPALDAAKYVIDRLVEASRRNESMARPAVLDAIAEATWRATSGQLAQANESTSLTNGWSDRLDVYSNGRPIAAKSVNQQAYLDAIRDHDLVFAVGPAGTGKTYLAVAAAIHMLKRGTVRKAILVRPAVEAGEKLGFLPGDQFEKVNPYLRPLLDALNDMMDYPTIKRFMATDIVEVVPLAFMRGRTLNDAVIILDEAQNTTRSQMKMFLTRMGQRSRMIVTGDTTQTDLDDPTESGLVDALRRLKRTRGVAMCALEREDVVRHKLVQRIIDAYEGAPANNRGGQVSTGDGV